MSTLQAARREFLTRITELTVEGPLTFPPHQDEYILPVYPDTLLGEIRDEDLPSDCQRLVMAVLWDEDHVTYNFMVTELDEGGIAEDEPLALLFEQRGSGHLGDIEEAENWTVGDMLHFLQGGSEQVEFDETDPTFEDMFLGLAASKSRKRYWSKGRRD